MRFIALSLLLLIPVTADAQRPNRARQNVERMLANAQADQSSRTRTRADDRRSEPQHTDRQRADRPRTDRQRMDHDRDDRDHRDRSKWAPANRSRGNARLRGNYWAGSFYALPNTGYGFGFYSPTPEAVEDARPREAYNTTTSTTGLLRLEVTPSSGLDYYVDGVFIGSSSNLGSDLELNAGARRVEVRAAGYKSLVFDVRLVEGRETIFRGSLESLTQTAPPPPPQPTGSRTMFIIPGCYVGNSPPAQSALRSGCDIKNLVTK